MKLTIHHVIRPGDIGHLTHLHGINYSKEFAYDTTVEAYVASGLAEFVKSFNSKRDRIWLVQANHHIVGSVAIVGRCKSAAQLRWFFTHPSYRGRGFGKRMLREALRFCKRQKYKLVFLWTTSELDAARHLYVEAGFKRIGQKTHAVWGRRATEERYELRF